VYPENKLAETTEQAGSGRPWRAGLFLEQE